MRRGDHIYGNGSRAPRKIISDCFKDREEELSFFRDLQRHEKEQVVASLLQPVSVEYEANGNYGLYRIESGGRKGQAAEFLAESGKNDYNWLKTPPATPLFPSLEMEANPQEQFVVHKEIPILQPLTRFAGTSEVKKTINKRPTSPGPKPKLPLRQKIPIVKPSISSSIEENNMKTAPLINPKTNQTAPNSLHDKTKLQFTPVVKSSFHQIERKPNFLSSNLSKSVGMEPDPNTKLKSRGVSPLLRANLEFSNDTPSNLKTTNRPASTTRGRPRNDSLTLPQKQEISSKTRRQSCSPSVARGRKMDLNARDANTPKAQQVLGSRMLDRFMNVRSSNIEAKTKLGNSMNEKLSSISNEERRVKINMNSSMNESLGYGRMMSKSSHDMALKHMEFQREVSTTTRKHVGIHGRNS